MIYFVACPRNTVLEFYVDVVLLTPSTLELPPMDALLIEFAYTGDFSFPYGIAVQPSAARCE